MGISSMGSEGEVTKAGAQTDRTVAMARALGITASLGARFACLFADHEHDAYLHPARGGRWQYRCPAAPRSYGLAEVLANLAYGRAKTRSRVELARCHERLRYLAGLLLPRPTPELPASLSPTARRVGEGFRLLAGLRDEQWGDDPFTFAREFVMAYCDVTNEQARRGVEGLERAGLMIGAGWNGRARLWRRGWSEVRG
jgi:hypothetical protein